MGKSLLVIKFGTWDLKFISAMVEGSRRKERTGDKLAPVQDTKTFLRRLDS